MVKEWWLQSQTKKNFLVPCLFGLKETLCFYTVFMNIKLILAQLQNTRSEEFIYIFLIFNIRLVQDWMLVTMR